jgi:hypothetical protein
MVIPQRWGLTKVSDEYQVCGSREARKLLRTHLLRVEDNGHLQRPRDRPSPVLLVEGSPGSGKTAFLDGIAEDLVNTVPFARFDFTTDPPGFEANRWREIDNALTTVVWELSRWCPVYGSLRFHRFAIGQLVRQLNLDLNRPHQAVREQVAAELERHRRVDQLRKVLRNAAAQLPWPLPDPVAWTVKTFGPYAADWLVAKATAWRALAGRYSKWYARRGAGDHIDVLIDLNRWAKDAHPAKRAQATRLMFAAFFADLQDNFRRRRRCGEWSFNSVLVLDNVAGAWGSAFLEELAQARALHRDQEPDGADPLTVVATSRAPVPVEDTPVVRILLRPLDLTTVHGMVGLRRWERGDIGLLARRIHAFTDGHPDAVALLLKAAAAHNDADVELNVLLADQAVVLIGRLLPGAPKHEVEDLVTLSAARDRDQAARLARRTTLLSGLPNPGAPQPDLWAVNNAGTQLLRRLLLRRLAARGPNDKADWLTVHGALRRFCHEAGARAKTGDESTRAAVGEMYHALATGDLEFVVTELAARLDGADPQEWLALLKSVTAAPRPPDDRSPEEQVEKLVKTVTAQDDKVVALAGVVAGLWVAADPATPGNRHLLHLRIARDYNGMADLAESPAIFVSESADHYKAAQQWR